MSASPLTQNARNLSALSGIDFCAPAATQQIRSARVRIVTPAAIMIDGEIFERVTGVDVRILPGALRCRRTRNI
jgi:diacylglycerol kinase family enzyme